MQLANLDISLPLMEQYLEILYKPQKTLNRPLSCGGHFVSGDLESLVYAQIA